MSVIVTGHRNGEILRYQRGKWVQIGKVRMEYLGPNRWRAFRGMDLDTYTEAGNRERVIRLFLRRIGIDPDELTTRPAHRAGTHDDEGTGR